MDDCSGRTWHSSHLRRFLGPFLIHGPHVVGTGSGVSLVDTLALMMQFRKLQGRRKAMSCGYGQHRSMVGLR
jgi:hypothetical protein